MKRLILQLSCLLVALCVGQSPAYGEPETDLNGRFNFTKTKKHDHNTSVSTYSEDAWLQLYWKVQNFGPGNYTFSLDIDPERLDQPDDVFCCEDVDPGYELRLSDGELFDLRYNQDAWELDLRNNTLGHNTLGLDLVIGHEGQNDYTVSVGKEINKQELRWDTMNQRGVYFSHIETDQNLSLARDIGASNANAASYLDAYNSPVFRGVTEPLASFRGGATANGRDGLSADVLGAYLPFNGYFQTHMAYGRNSQGDTEYGIALRSFETLYFELQASDTNSGVNSTSYGTTIQHKGVSFSYGRAKRSDTNMVASQYTLGFINGNGFLNLSASVTNFKPSSGVAASTLAKKNTQFKIQMNTGATSFYIIPRMEERYDGSKYHWVFSSVTHNFAPNASVTVGYSHSASDASGNVSWFKDLDSSTLSASLGYTF